MTAMAATVEQVFDVQTSAPATGEAVFQFSPAPPTREEVRAAELAELAGWFDANVGRLPQEPFGLVPGRGGWAVWVSDPQRFYASIVAELKAGGHAGGLMQAALAEKLKRLQSLANGEPRYDSRGEYGQMNGGPQAKRPAGKAMAVLKKNILENLRAMDGQAVRLAELVAAESAGLSRTDLEYCEVDVARASGLLEKAIARIEGRLRSPAT